MKKNLTEIVFILDRSGSMSGLEQDTIGGFNSMIKQQKNAEGEALISTILFDNVSEVLHDRINVKDIQPLSDHDYMVRGCTALLDAIGRERYIILEIFISMQGGKTFRNIQCLLSQRMEWRMLAAIIAAIK